MRISDWSSDVCSSDLGSRALRRIAAFGVIGSTGTLLAAISVFEPRALAAGLYSLPHTTLAGALLFLTTDLIVRRRPSHGDAATARGPRSEDVRVGKEGGSTCRSRGSLDHYTKHNLL